MAEAASPGAMETALYQYTPTEPDVRLSLIVYGKIATVLTSGADVLAGYQSTILPPYTISSLPLTAADCANPVSGKAMESFAMVRQNRRI